MLGRILFGPGQNCTQDHTKSLGVDCWVPLLVPWFTGLIFCSRCCQSGWCQASYLMHDIRKKRLPSLISSLCHFMPLLTWGLESILTYRPKETDTFGYIGKGRYGESPNSWQWFIEIWFTEELDVWCRHAVKVVFPIHRCIVILSVIIIQLQKCISIKVCGLKAVSCVLYSPPASLCLDFRLQIRKDSWGSGSPQACYT